MLVTNAHLMWWRSKREPGWASQIQSKVKPSAPSVHDLINAQVRYPHARLVTKDDTELHNTLHLIKLRSKREDNVLMNVQDLMASPHSSERRVVWCSRFLRKIRRARREVVRG